MTTHAAPQANAHTSSSPITRTWWLIPLFFVVLVLTAGPALTEPGPWRLGVQLVLAVSATAVLATWSRRPQVAALGNAALVAAVCAPGFINEPIFITSIIAALLVGLSRPSRDAWRLTAGSATIILAGLAVRGALTSWGWSQSAGQAVVMAALLAAAVAIGSSVRSRREARAERVQRSATEEQLRMAHDLHDGVGHGLAVIAMQAGVARHVLDQDPDAARASLTAIRDTSRESLDALRAELSTLAYGDQASTRSPRRGLDDLPVLIERVRAGGLDIVVDPAGTSTHGVPMLIGETAYLVIQESLTNVLRHASATSALIRIHRETRVLTITVTDDGNGGTSADPHSGMGITGMRARVTVLGGTLDAGRNNAPRAEREGTGFRVNAVLPLIAS